MHRILSKAGENPLAEPGAQALRGIRRDHSLSLVDCHLSERFQLVEEGLSHMEILAHKLILRKKGFAPGQGMHWNGLDPFP